MNYLNKNINKKMTDAPKPISVFAINIENEGKQYEIILSQKSNNLLILSKDLNTLKRYEQQFTSKNLYQISKFFMYLIFQKLKKINTSTNHQKQFILFFVCVWLIKSKVIIKGDKASEKTHYEELFSEMLGTDLLTNQMNPDLTSSIFTSQSILNEDLNEKEIELLKSYLSDIIILK